MSGEATDAAAVPDEHFPDPRVPVPPEPAPVQVLHGHFERFWTGLDAAGQLRFLAQWDTLVLPLAEADPQGDPGFRAVTFLYRDRAQAGTDAGADQAADPGPAPAEAVILSANALVDHRNPAATEFVRVAGGAAATDGLWALTLRMPQDWEASYRITASPAGTPVPWRVAADRRSVRVAADAGGTDPRNPHLGAAMDGRPTSVIRLPGAPAAPWLAAPTPRLDAAETRRRAEQGQAAPGHNAPRRTQPLPSEQGQAAPEARLQELRVPDTLAGRLRKVWVYAPPEAAPPETAGAGRELPLVLLHDGQVWARYQNLPATISAAIGRGALPPVYVAMIDSVDVPTRSVELSGPVGTVDFVARDLLPLLRDTLPVSPRAGDTVVAGASYGGLAALWQVARYPDAVGNALAQSPSLWRYDLTEYLLAVKDRPRIRLQAGLYESTVHRPAAALAESLGAGGADVGFRSITGGHDWAWWSPWLIRGLSGILQDDRPLG